MDLKQYVKDATRTESRIDEITLTDPELFLFALKTFIAAGNILDCFKKNVFYGKDTEKQMFEWLQAIRFYQFELEKLDPDLNIDPRIFHSLIGIATESAELMMELEKAITKEIDETKILEEWGDCCWYGAIGIDAMGGDFGNILETNITKLRERFPEKFSSEKAINRNDEAEQEVVSKTLDKETK